MQCVRDSGISLFFVYGDPAYYGRFGFTAEAAGAFAAPYPLKYPYGWQAVNADGALAQQGGELGCVQALSRPELW
jgi:putative acetyltransferase